MSFSYKFKTLRSGNFYVLIAQPKISTQGDGNTGEAETVIIEGSEENSIRFFPKWVDERIKGSLERLHAQISALTEMMDHLIQNNSTKKSTRRIPEGSDTSTRRLTVKDRDLLSSRDTRSTIFLSRICLYVTEKHPNLFFVRRKIHSDLHLGKFLRSSIV